ncbi:hypothetical protein RJ641_003763 [Dillenia turbinata]|uniref:Uncharacterized protein n=1 Tax=Dillenia turbinata TaxID=194707 RepID=A0AAN8Z7N4_9MAGN
MGSSSSTNKPGKGQVGKKLDPRELMEKIRFLEVELNNVVRKREEEAQAYEQEVLVSTLKEAEWKKERKNLKEEVKRLKKNVEEKEKRIRELEKDEMVVGKISDKEWQRQILGASILVEHLKEERARRDEAVVKWKTLYLAIKTELDNLIQRTHQGENFWRSDEESIITKELQKEVKEKRETIEALRKQLAVAQQEKSRSERELDILRQSLRITGNKKKPR